MRTIDPYYLFCIFHFSTNLFYKSISLKHTEIKNKEKEEKGHAFTKLRKQTEKHQSNKKNRCGETEVGLCFLLLAKGIFWTKILSQRLRELFGGFFF